MKRFLWACLTAGLLLGGAGAARAGAVLVDSSVYSNDTGFIILNYPTTLLAQFDDTSSNSVGSPSPNSATASVTDSQTATPGGSISASGTTTLTVSPAANSFTQLTAPASSSSSASVDNTAYTSSSAGNTTSSSGDFTLAAPSSFTLSVTFSGQALATAANDGSSGVPDDRNYVYGFYLLRNTDTGHYYAEGYNEVFVPTANTLAQDSGYNYVTSTSGYNPSATNSGVLPAGHYTFESLLETVNDGYGYTMSGTASGSQSYTLDLAPAATPEPASLTLLGLGALGLTGYGWRKRRQALSA